MDYRHGEVSNFPHDSERQGFQKKMCWELAARQYNWHEKKLVYFTSSWFPVLKSSEYSLINVFNLIMAQKTLALHQGNGVFC